MALTFKDGKFYETSETEVNINALIDRARDIKMQIDTMVPELAKIQATIDEAKSLTEN